MGRDRIDWRTVARFLAPFLVLWITAWAFENAAPNVLAYDDRAQLPIPRAPGESILSVLERLFRGDIWSEQRFALKAYRPLTFASTLVDAAVFGPEPWALHAGSILWHLAVTMALYGFLRAVLRADPWPAAVAASVFGVHPVHSEAVASAFNRGDLFVALLTLAAMAWLRSAPVEKRGGGLISSGGVAVLYALALLCKESAVTLPALVLLLGRLEKERPFPMQRSFAIVALPLLGYAALRSLAMARTTWQEELVLGPTEGLLLSLTALRDYLALWFWPHPLRAIRTDYVAEGLFSAALVWIVLGFVIIVCKRRLRGVTIGLLVFVVAIVPSLPMINRLGNAQVFAERYLYLPSLGLSIALAFALGACSGRVRILSIAAGLLACFACVWQTRARNEVWHDELGLFQADLRAAPDNPDAALNVGLMLKFHRRRAEHAELCESQAQKHAERRERLLMECALLFEDLGDRRRAERFYGLAIRAPSPPPPAFYTYARFVLKEGRRAEAEALYGTSITLERDEVRRRTTTAEMLLKLHPERIDEALGEVDAALALDPGFGMAKNLRARILTAVKP